MKGLFARLRSLPVPAPHWPRPVLDDTVIVVGVQGLLTPLITSPQFRARPFSARSDAASCRMAA
jgi:hypothetical protein